MNGKSSRFRNGLKKMKNTHPLKIDIQQGIDFQRDWSPSVEKELETATNCRTAKQIKTVHFPSLHHDACSCSQIDFNNGWTQSPGFYIVSHLEIGSQLHCNKWLSTGRKSIIKSLYNISIPISWIIWGILDATSLRRHKKIHFLPSFIEGRSEETFALRRRGLY